jgi:hypothetical protein
LRRLNKNRIYKNLLAKTIKQMALTLRKGLLGTFANWSDKAGLKKQKDEILHLADMVMGTPALERLEDRLRRKPFRDAFDRIRANPFPPKVRAAVKALQHCHDNELARAYYLWKLRALRMTKDQEIGVLKIRP